jgi:hypothetical protein
LVNATAADVTSVVITLYHGTTTLATATATGLMATYPTATSLSAPFDVLGTFNYAADGNWSYSGWLAATSVIPTDAKVVVTFSDANVSTAVWGAPSGVTSIFTAAPTPLAATSVTASTATLNGKTNNAAILTSFWYGTPSHTFAATATPVLSAGWTATPNVGPIAATAVYSANLAGLTSGATYYYVAWAYDGTTWYPGATLSFITGTSATGTTAAKLATLKLLYKQIADVEKEIRQKVAADKRARVDLRAFATDLKTAAKYATHREVSHGVMLTEAESTKLAVMQASIRTLQQTLKTEQRKFKGKATAAQKTVIDTIKAQIKAATVARTAYLKSVHTLARTQYSARLDTLIADAQMKLAFVQGLLARLP